MFLIRGGLFVVVVEEEEGGRVRDKVRGKEGSLSGQCITLLRDGVSGGELLGC